MTDPILARLEGIEQALRQSDRPLNFEEAARFLSCSKSYLYKLTHKRRVPCYKPLGKRLFFIKAELEGFIMQKPVKLQSQIEQEAIDHVAGKPVGARC